MGKINYGRVILGGIVWGIVAGFLDWFLNGVLVGQHWGQRHRRRSTGRTPTPEERFLFWLFLLYSVGGIVLVWVYAAIRPRFGGGVRHRGLCRAGGMGR